MEDEAAVGGARAGATAQILGGEGGVEERVEPLTSRRGADAAKGGEDDGKEGAVQLATQPGRCLASFSAERATKRVEAEAEEARLWNFLGSEPFNQSPSGACSTFCDPERVNHVVHLRAHPGGR